MGKGYATLAKVALRCPVSDPQCGFAAYHRDFLEQVLPMVQADSWFWNTEIMLRAVQLGLPISEIPVRWREKRPRDSRVPMTAIAYMLKEVAKASWRIRGVGPRRE